MANSKEKQKKKRKKKEPLVKQKIDQNTQPREANDNNKQRKRKTVAQWNEGAGLNVEVLEDGKCLIVSVQMKCSNDRRKKLYAWIKTQARPPDVIAIQDPPLSLAWQLPRNYGRWCRGDDGMGNPVPLTEEDCPTHFAYAPPYLKARDKQAVAEAEKKRDARIEAAKQMMQGMSLEEGAEEELGRKKLAKVAFLVHNSITWEPSEPEDGCSNRGIVATIRIPMEHGSLAIHNFYNHNHRLDVVALMAPCRNELDVHVCVGDGNMKHERWGGHKVSRPDTDAVTLVREMDAIPMHCKNDQGKHTYGRSKRTKNTWVSTLDLFLVSSALANQSVWSMPEVKGYESDHAVTSLSIDMDLSRKVSLRFMWEDVNRTEYETFMKDRIRYIVLPITSDRASLSRILDAVLGILHEAKMKVVPVRRVFEHNPHEQASTPRTSEQNRQNWRQFIEHASDTSGGIHSLAKRASSWGVPRPMTHTPAFEVGSSIIKENGAKVQCYMESTWSRTTWKGGPRKSAAEATSTSPTSPPPTSSIPRPKLPLPFLDPQRKTFFSPQSIKEGEIANLLKSAPKRKASGTDGIAYEALKLCSEVIEPVLSWIFQACLDLRIHPDRFKECITVVIPKPGKPPQLPKSYRPIAILNTLAKFLERILADRYKELLVNAGILPKVQYGAPGRSTTLALELLTSQVYTGWTKDKKVSLLGLDLTGAYDHIDRAKLLAELIKRGIPDWLVEITWSFLSDRRSFIHIPGYDGDEYWIDIGVPQGSPLSSLLFLVYAAPLLERFAKDYPGAMLFSYVDDTYILVTGDDYKKNTIVMGKIHDRLWEWAAQNNLHFSPTKYHVLHFAKPGSPKKDENYSLLPSMIGFDSLTPKERKDILEPTIKILGVIFDQRLTWVDHVYSLIDRVRKDLATFKRISGTTWGAVLEKRRHFYEGKLLTKITYACAAWFLHDPYNDLCHKKIQFAISPRALSLLESLQTEMLLVIAKAWKRTVVQLIEKELHFLPILLKLHEVAMNHRCQKYDSEEYALIKRTRFGTQNHPYSQMAILVDRHVNQIRDEQQLQHGRAQFDKLWSQPPKRRVWIKEFNQLKAYEEAKERFDHFRRMQAAKLGGQVKVLQPAYQTNYSDHCLKLYYGLDIAQTTILLAMRTGNIGVNANPVLRHATKSTDMSCPLCGYRLHTIKHLIFQCSETKSHLPSLIHAAGHEDYDKFMNQDTKLIASYAIAYFGLAQFASVKDKKEYQFPREMTILHTKKGAGHK